MKEYKRQHRLDNIDKLREKSKKYYIDNKEYILEKSSLHYENNKEYKLEYQKEYAYTNREKISIYKREYQRNRRNTDPTYKLKYTVGRMIRNSLRIKNFSKSKKTIDILGCDIEFFKNYIESLFTEDMCWSNYGEVWDLDHKIPLATAVTEEDVLELNHYTNLQPLDSYINRYIKRDKLDFF